MPSIQVSQASQFTQNFADMAPVNEGRAPGRAIFQLQEDPEKKNSTGEAGEALLVVLQASGEASCVYTDIKPGITATCLRPGSRCGRAYLKYDW